MTKTLKSLLTTFYFLLFTFYFAVNTALAQVKLDEQIKVQGPQYVGATFAVTRIETVLLGIISLMLIIAGIIFFFCILISALQWQLSQGDQSKITTARSRINNCLIGFSIVALALALMLMIQYFFGVTVFPV